MTLPVAITTQDRIAHMQTCLAAKVPKMRHHPAHLGRVAIVCYGPSLADTYKQIEGPIITVSGAHDWLIQRHRIPTYHVDIDPRLHKLAMLTPMPWVSYLMASVCHPGMWQHLRGHKVAYWNAAHDPETMQWIEKNDPNGPLLSGGSVAGLAAISVGHYLGWRQFDVYGMDCCLRNGERHAGKHAGGTQPVIEHEVGGRVFQTTPQLLQAANEAIHWQQKFNLDLTFHGDSMISAMIAK